MDHVRENFFQLSSIHKLRRCEQVAAVCYRIAEHRVEFLLVRTRGGRWTFPKGSTEPGLTHAQAAAMEAFEEAGVHGRIEESSFAGYRCGARYIHVHLCEVTRMETPQEFGRNPTWFCAARAKRQLRQGRRADDAAAITRVVDGALKRIAERRSAGRSLRGLQKDPLRTVRLEARVQVWRRPVVRAVGHAPALGAKILQLSAPQEIDGSKRRLP
jgi:ADP-ribose pyrophosphatase YjhB (NUDIX family)